MQALLATIKSALAARNNGLVQREIHNATRNQEVAQLLDFLRLAAVCRVTLFYEGVITPDLGLWGFDVVTRSALRARRKRSHPSEANTQSPQ